MPNCLSCGSDVGEYDSGYYSRSMLCITCWTQKASQVPSILCSKCGMTMRQEEARMRNGSNYCGYCYSELERIERMPVCHLCEHRIEGYQQSIRTADYQLVHSECAQKSRQQGRAVSARCSYCRAVTDRFKVSREGWIMCSRCSVKSERKIGEFTPAAALRPNGSVISSLADKIGALLA